MADPIPWLNPNQLPLIQLPPEMLMNIMLNVLPKDLQALCRTSRAHAVVCATDYFWNRRMKIDYPEFSDTRNTGSYKQIWKGLYELQSNRHYYETEVTMGEPFNMLTALVLANNAKKIQLLRLLSHDNTLKLGEDLSYDNIDYAIDDAVRNGQIEIVRLLLQDERFYPGYEDGLAIRSAIQYDHIEIVKLLLNDPRVDTWGSFRESIKYNRIEIFKLLLADDRVDPADDDNRAIIYAAEKGRVKGFKLLLADYRVDPSDLNNAAIRLASGNGHPEIVKLLLADQRVNPAADDNYAIIFASENGHVEIVKLLLEDGRADPSASNNQAIKLAYQHNHFEVVKLLLLYYYYHELLDCPTTLYLIEQIPELEEILKLLIYMTNNVK